MHDLNTRFLLQKEELRAYLRIKNVQRRLNTLSKCIWQVLSQSYYTNIMQMTDSQQYGRISLVE